MLDLQAIFGPEAPAPTIPPTVAKPAAPEPTPEGDAAGGESGCCQTTFPTMGTPATDDALAALGLAGWVRRPDVTGRWGWEAPDLTEADRWWGRCRFEDLPEPPADWGKADQQGMTPQIAPSCVSRAADDRKHLPGMEPSNGQHGPPTGCQAGER